MLSRFAPCCTLTLFFLLLQHAGFAQSPAESLPQDAGQLLHLAHMKNGLNGQDVRPWHIRGTYALYDQNGKPQSHGTYEEWWFAPDLYKRAFTDAKDSETDYADGKGLYRDGAQPWLGDEIDIRELLLNPIPDGPELNGFRLREETIDVQHKPFLCARLTFGIPHGGFRGGNLFPEYCFDSTIPVVRMFYGVGEWELVYDHLGIFQGHYLARQLSLYITGKLRMQFQLEAAETIPNEPESVVKPPASAVPVDLDTIYFMPRPPFFTPVTLKPFLWGSGDAPLEFINPRAIGGGGNVTCRVTIGGDGHVVKLEPLKGPFDLRRVTDDLQHGVFRPLQVFGKPHVMMMEFQFVYKLP